MAPLNDISRAFGQQHESSANAQSVSRTMQYRKVTKPLLERRRRARMNQSLDELRQMLVSELQNDDGENFARWEKADILELTVKHLSKLHQQQHKKIFRSQQILGQDDKFREGFANCAQEVSRVLATTPKVDEEFGSSIMIHLGHTLNEMQTNSSVVIPPLLIMTSFSSVCSNSCCHSGGGNSRYNYTPPASPQQIPPKLTTFSSMTDSSRQSKAWRPWCGE